MGPDTLPGRWGWLKPEERDFDAVLHRLHREAAEVIPGLSPDPRQADPVIVMLLRAFAREYVELYHQIDDSVGMAYRTLVARLVQFPHAPEPATTVLALKAKDAGTRIPVDFEVMSSQPIVLGARRTVQAHFSPYEEGVVSGFDVAAVVLVEASGHATRIGELPPGAAPGRWNAARREAPAVFLALDAAEPAPGDPAEIFLHGDDAGVRQCLWSRWCIPSASGAGSRAIHGGPLEPPFVPGQAFYDAVPFDPPVFTFRSDARRIRSPYEPQFVKAGGAPLLAEACAAPKELGAPGAALPPARGTRHWVRVDLDPAADLTAVRGVRATTNAVLVANRELRTSGAIQVDATPAHSWIFPEDVSLANMLRMERVIDLKSGHLYRSSDTREGLDSLRAFRLVEWLEGETRRLKVELLNREEPPKASQVECVYSLTLGPAANELAPGSITQVFTPPQVFPGLLSVTNLVPTRGGRPPRTPDLKEDELRAALRHRGRTVVADDYLETAVAFDPERVRGAGLSRGVCRGPRGLRSSVCVTVDLAPGSFVNVLEREAFRKRMETHLQDRSAMGETVEVRFADDVS